LPLNHGPIDKALLLGLRACLRSLQVTNPNLLLTAAQLRSAEREAHHMPALALAVSKILCRMPKNAKHKRLVSTISQWSNTSGPRNNQPKQVNLHDEVHIAAEIEKQIASAILIKQEAALTARKRKVGKKDDNVQESDFSDLDGSSVSDHGSVDENQAVARKISVEWNAADSFDSSSDPACSLAGESQSPIELAPETTVVDATNDDDDEWW
jgi:hypothetical protein